MHLSECPINGSGHSPNTLPLQFNYASFLEPLWNTIPGTIFYGLPSFFPTFSDAEFKETLLKCLAKRIDNTGEEKSTLVILCFCVLRAIDGELITVAEAG